MFHRIPKTSNMLIIKQGIQNICTLNMLEEIKRRLNISKSLNNQVEFLKKFLNTVF